MDRRKFCLKETGIIMAWILFCKIKHPEVLLGADIAPMLGITIMGVLIVNLAQHILEDRIIPDLTGDKRKLGIWVVCIIEFGLIWLIIHGVLLALISFANMAKPSMHLVTISYLYTVMQIFMSKFPEICKHPLLSLDDDLPPED